MKILLWVVVIIGAVFEFIKTRKSYRKDNGKLDLISLIALSFMIPSIIILLVIEIIDK